MGLGEGLGGKGVEKGEGGVARGCMGVERWGI